jgi:hypothetical protein
MNYYPADNDFVLREIAEADMEETSRNPDDTGSYVALCVLTAFIILFLIPVYSRLIPAKPIAIETFAYRL